MIAYETVKWIHVVSSVVLAGTGLGSAFHMFMANRSDSAAARAVVARQVVLADWIFTTPAVLVQPASGLAMAHMAGWPLSAPWLAVSIGFFLLAGACWLPVVWLQMRMARLAKESVESGSPESAEYWRCARLWEALGYPAFAAMVAVFYLMVAKPAWPWW
jgi:uncharacterized membrane protein